MRRAGEWLSRVSTQAATLLLVLYASGPSDVQAKPVQLEWEELKDAIQYELKLERGGKALNLKKTQDTNWSGDLPFGVYQYQIRAIDKFNRPGEWSKPELLVVMPPPPVLLHPQDESSMEFYGKGNQIALKWKPVEAADAYEVELRCGQSLVKKKVKEPSYALTQLSSGKCKWDVRVVLEYEGEQWRSDPSKTFEFNVDLKTMGRPDPISPIGKEVAKPTGRVRLDWKSVEGAREYWVRWEKVSMEGPAPTESSLPSGNPLKTRENGIEIELRETGNYRWYVEAKRDEKVSSRSEIARFELVKPERKWYLLFRVGETYVRDSSGGNSYSPQVKWTPDWRFSSTWALRGELGYHTLKAKDKSNISVAEVSAWLSFAPSSLNGIFIDLGGGMQSWLSKESVKILGAGIGWRRDFPLYRIIDGLRLDGAIIPFSAGTSSQISIGVMLNLGAFSL